MPFNELRLATILKTTAAEHRAEFGDKDDPDWPTWYAEKVWSIIDEYGKGRYITGQSALVGALRGLIERNTL